MCRFIQIRLTCAAALGSCGGAIAQDKPFVPEAPAEIAAEPKWDGDKPFMPEMHGRALAPPVLPAALLDALRAPAKTAFDLFDVSVQEIPRQENDAETTLSVRLNEVDRTVRLHPYSMRAAGAKLFVQNAAGLLLDTVWPEPATYRGTVDGLPGAEVAASMVDGKVSMLILPADPEEPTWHVQPLTDALPGMPAEAHVVYRNVDVIPSEGTCGWIDNVEAAHPVPVAPRQAPLAERVHEHAAAPPPMPGAVGDKELFEGELNDGPEGGGSPEVPNIRCEIGLDADFEFYQANGSSVFNTIYDMELIMNQVGLIYQSQVAISYTQTIIIVRTAEPDPYGATNPNTLICEFGNWWNTNVTTQRDVAHLFTGKDLDGTTVGFAWIGAICATASNCNGGNVSYGLVQSRFSTTMANRIQDSAHELGHNWNGCHCNTGGNCGGGSSNPVCGIMTSAISGQLTFDAAAVTAITAYRDGRPCLDVWQNPTHVNWANNGAENGSFANPWNTIFEGLDAALVGGELHVQGGNYFQNPNIFKILTIRAFNGTVRIGAN